MLSSWCTSKRIAGGQLMTYGRSTYKAMDAFCIDRATWGELAEDRDAWRDAINGGLLNASRKRRAVVGC